MMNLQCDEDLKMAKVILSGSDEVELWAPHTVEVTDEFPHIVPYLILIVF